MRHWIAACAAALAIAACGRDESPKPADAAAKIGEAARQMGEAISASTKVEPVDFRALRDWMPETFAGMKRTGSEGARMNVMGIQASSAEASYEDGKGSRIRIEVKDMGNLSGVTAMALAWVNVEIDKEGDSGYERTTTLGGRKAFERYAAATRTGELDVIAGGRFVVGMKATGVDVAAFRAAVSALDLDRLESLKSPAAAPSAPAKP